MYIDILKKNCFILSCPSYLLKRDISISADLMGKVPNDTSVNERINRVDFQSASPEILIPTLISYSSSISCLLSLFLSSQLAFSLTKQNSTVDQAKERFPIAPKSRSLDRSRSIELARSTTRFIFCFPNFISKLPETFSCHRQIADYFVVSSATNVEPIGEFF